MTILIAIMVSVFAIESKAQCVLVGNISIDTTLASSGIVVLNGSASNGTPPYNYYWYIPNGNPSSSNTQITTVQYNYPSINLVCLTVTDANGCYDSLCTSFTIGGNISCSGFGFGITETQTSQNTWNFSAPAGGGVQPYTYAWTVNGGVSTCGYNQMMCCASFPSAGTYTVCCTVTDAVGCSVYNCHTVVVGNAGSCIANFYDYSVGDSVYFTNWSTASGTAQYTWDFGDGTSSNQWTSFGHHYPVSGNYTVCLYLSDTFNNCADTFCQSVYSCGLNADFTYTLNGNVVSFQNISTGPYNSLQWYYYGSPISTNPNLVYYFPVSGTYPVSLYVTDSSGYCFDSVTQWIQINTPINDTLSGHVFNDVNGNGIQDAGESPLSNEAISISGVWVYTDTNGDWILYVADGTWTATLNVISQWTQTFPISPSFYTVTVSSGMNLTGLDFGLQSNLVTVCGFVYNDANNNGVMDAGETVYGNQWVNIGNYWATTNANGYYSQTVPAGIYTVGIYSYPNGGTITQPLSGSYSVAATTIGQVYCGNNFGFYSSPNQNLIVYLSPYTTVAPGFPAWYDVSYYNAGTVPVNATVILNYDPQLDYATSTYPTPDNIDLTNHILTWNVGVVNPGGYGWMWVDFTCPASVTLGSNIFNTAIIQPIAGDNYPLNNIDTSHQVVQASWDPNEKEVSPHGVGVQGLIHANTKLNYTIHFQNTGTAPAVNVEVVDTLSPLLDWESLTILSHSHPMVASFDQNTGVLRCYFNNIMLPDSGSDNIGSMGNVEFSINPVTGIADGAVINNFGDIYFDFNAPVRTATTVNTIDYNLSVSDNKIENTIRLYPNPASETAYLSVTGNESGKYEVSITNLLGQEVKSVSGKFNQMMLIDLSKMEKGIYFLNIISDNETVTVQKLIVR